METIRFITDLDHVFLKSILFILKYSINAEDR